MFTTRHSFRSLPGVALTGALLLVPHVAHAQSQSDKTSAETLFQDGKRLMAEGKYSEACPKLDESNKIDPGAGTLTALALCHRGEGKTATAWSEFKEVISLARRDNRKDREQVAEENINELEPKLSKITITIDRAAQQQGLEIKLDAQKIPLAMAGSPFPADPGVHKLTISATGFKTRESVIELGAERDDKKITVAPLDADQTAQTGPAAGTTTEAPKSGSGLKTASYIIGGAGIVGLGIGIVTGILAASKHGDADCKNDICPNADATDKEKSAATMGNISTVGFIAGGVLLAGGVVLNILAPSSKSSPSTTGRLQFVPSVSPQGGFGSFVGRF